MYVCKRPSHRWSERGHYMLISNISQTAQILSIAVFLYVFYIYIIFFIVSPTVDIRHRQAHRCSILGVTTDNEWIVDLHVRLESSQVNPAPGFFCFDSAKPILELYYTTIKIIFCDINLSILLPHFYNFVTWLGCQFWKDNKLPFIKYC